MDELGFNKIAGAVLATALGVMMIREVPHLLMHSSAPKTPVYQVGPIVQEGGEADAVEVPFPSPEFIASMDATRGAKVFKKCTSCHNADNGGANGTGPNLWNVVGSNTAAKQGFKYSAAMTNAGFAWDYENLNGYLEKPTKYVSGTNMNFIGLKKEKDRAAVIEYLRVASDAPIARPVAAQAPLSDIVQEDVTPQEDTPEKVDSGN